VFPASTDADPAVDAISVAAATCVFAGGLSNATRDSLLGPWRSAGLAHAVLDVAVARK
jgi:hypothetical protein